MKRKSSFSTLRWISMALIFAAVLLTVIQLARYSRIRNNFPPGMVIAGVPVGGMDNVRAAERLVEAYGIPIEVHYADSIIQIKPSVVGFEIGLDSMLAAADLQRITQPFWSAFYDYLFNRLDVPIEVPLVAEISEDRMRAYLTDELAARYDKPPVVAMPIPGTVNFEEGVSGKSLDIDRAVILIEDALKSPSNRTVNLSYREETPPRPSYDTLKIQVQQIIDVAGFDGIVELYLLDLETRKEVNFAYQNGEELQPEIAFTAASTMKIPIMTSVFKRVKEPVPERVTEQLELMIELSQNDPADRLMETTMDTYLGPLQVTEDLRQLGLENTFLAGMFYVGAPLLVRVETPANTRADINTDPDPYNQTTSIDMGMLLDDIYQCSETGGGNLIAVFPEDITQQECQLMLTYLARNKIGVLLQAGLPDGTKFAHKHGWLLEYDELIHHMSDAGIVYSPGGNYVITIYLYNENQIVFDMANRFVGDISTAIYNYFNLE